jgi:L-fuconolactonase
MNIDAHQHFWNYTADDYPWISSGMERLAHNYLPPHLIKITQPHNITGSVAVQARQSTHETEWLLQLADEHNFIRGVVGWVDLRDPEVEKDLERFSQHDKFVGVRHVVQDEPDPRFLLRDNFLHGISQLSKYDLTYDILIFPNQLPAACEFVKLFPNQRFVLDHMAKPDIEHHNLSEWKRDFDALAEHDNVVCKVSGLVTEAKWKVWHQRDFTPYLDAALEAFGPERLLFGSDWPVCLLSAEYAEVLCIANSLIDRVSLHEAKAIRGLNTAQVYGLQPQ